MVSAYNNQASINRPFVEREGLLSGVSGAESFFVVPRMKFILGKKLKMDQIWKDGKVIPVTLIKAEPNKVSAIRTREKHAYNAVQLSMGKTKKEFRSDAAGYSIGDTVAISIFKEGDKVDVSGTMKGRGFAGVVKRYNFGGGPKTHGQKNRHRAPGSIGSTAPQRVVPGRRMAGHMGMTRTTVKKLTVAAVDEAGNILMIKGAVPGAPGSLVEVRTIT